MKNTLSFILTAFVGLSFWSCDDMDDNEIARNPTTLELTVRDGDGVAVDGATVKLYSSEEDWISEENQIGAALVSDVNGKVIFTDLTDANYYFLAEKDCLNNVNETHSTAVPLLLATNNVMDITVDETGTLSVIVNRVGVYNVLIDGVYSFDINGGETRYVFNIYAGIHEVRLIATGDYNESNTFLIDCGQTTPVPFN